MDIHADIERLIVPTTWALQLRDADGLIVQQDVVHNGILTAGRRDAMYMLTGLNNFGVFQWIELGSDASPTLATMSGTQSPLLLPGTSTPFRAQGAWSLSGTDAVLNVAILGSSITGVVREAALYPSRSGGDALYRIVTPSAMTLSGVNTLTISINLAA